MISELQQPLDSGFGAKSEPSEVLEGIDLNGKTALVTGGYSGIGLETTRALSNCGARVIVPARRRDVAIKELDSKHAELKSMRTSNIYRSTGVGTLLLKHVLYVASNRGYNKISLETGSQEYFKPARNLYEKFGFKYCGPFADYKPDPHSQFMVKYTE